MVKKIRAVILALIVCAGCERAEQTVESNMNPSVASVVKPETAPMSSQHANDSANTQPSFHVPDIAENTLATLKVVNHPELNEITPLLSLSIDSDHVQAFVQRYHLRKGHKGGSGSFTSADQAYTLMFRENRIESIILKASPWPKNYGDPHWAVYSQPLPGKLTPTDSRNDVATKLGKPIQVDGNHWANNSIVLWCHFQDEDTAIDEVWVSAAQR